MPKITMTAIIVVLSSIIVYLIGAAVNILLLNTLREPKEKTNSPPKWLSTFNKPIFKIPIGILIITGTLIQSLNLVKVLPLIMKVGIIGLDFIVIYTVINYLFINKKTN
jgi:uncharacterized PurR-regulated membrane protein YhhQ (DUF165 family)